VWVGRYVEPTLDNGTLRTVLRARIIGPCAEISKSAAQATLQEWLRPLNAGVHTPLEAADFQTFHDKWVRDLLPTYRASTRDFYQSTARRWILPYFTGDRLVDIRPADVQQFINLFAAKYSRSALRHIRATLNCLFETAKAWHYLRENPAEGLKLPGGTAVQRATVLTPAQVATVLNHLTEPTRTMAVIAALTGVRESEVFALQRGDFDFARNTVTIARRLYRGKIDAPKTAKSAREIPLHPAAIDAVRTLPDVGPYLFLAPDGSGGAALEHKTRRAFVATARARGIPAFTWRSFRRSAESAMHKGGVSLKAQQAVLGHSNPNMTLVYAETDPEAMRGAVGELGKLIFPNLSQNNPPGPQPEKVSL
jgi:integrase